MPMTSRCSRLSSASFSSPQIQHKVSYYYLAPRLHTSRPPELGSHQPAQSSLPKIRAARLSDFAPLQIRDSRLEGGEAGERDKKVLSRRYEVFINLAQESEIGVERLRRCHARV